MNVKNDLMEAVSPFYFDVPNLSFMLCSSIHILFTPCQVLFLYRSWYMMPQSNGLQTAALTPIFFSPSFTQLLQVYRSV
jgi:hypothetical protein